MRVKILLAAVMTSFILLGTVTAASAGYNDDTWFIGTQGGMYVVPGFENFYEQGYYALPWGGIWGLQAGRAIKSRKIDVGARSSLSQRMVSR